MLIRNFNSTLKKKQKKQTTTTTTAKETEFFNINIRDKWKCISLYFYI